MTTLARKKHAPYERQIAKTLGLTDAQLAALLRIRAGYWPGNAAQVLRAKGLAATGPTTGQYAFCSGLTEAGEETLKRARALGY